MREWNINELEMFFSKTILPKTIKLNPHTTIIDMPLFIDSHLQTVKANNGSA